MGDMADFINDDTPDPDNLDVGGDEVPTCPICDYPFYFGWCRGCGFDGVEDADRLQGLLDDNEEDLKK